MSITPANLDEREQEARIRLLRADTALKRQSFELAPIQLFISSMTMVSAVSAAIVTGLKLVMGR